MCKLVKRKETILKILLLIFRKSLIYLYKNDNEFKAILSNVNCGCFSISVLKSDLRINVVLGKKDVYVDSGNRKCDLEIVFKNLCFAFKVFSGLISLEEVFAYKGIILKGSISDALTITRAIKRLQALIFPDLWIGRTFKEFAGTKLEEKLTFLKFYFYFLMNVRR